MTQTYPSLPRFDSLSTQHYTDPNPGGPSSINSFSAQHEGGIETEATYSSAYSINHTASTSHTTHAPFWSRTETETTTVSPCQSTGYSHQVPCSSPNEESPEVEIITILPSDIISASSGAELEFIAMGFSGMLRSSGTLFSDFQRPTDWAKIYRALETSYSNKPLTPSSGNGKIIWTRVVRVLFDPETLMEEGEVFDLRDDSAIIKRELTRQEVVDLVRKSMKLREEKERLWIESHTVGQGGRRD